jgi:hypothetical protein
MDVATQKIYSLIPKVMADVGAVGKNGRNDHANYKFRSIDDIYNHLQPALSKHGVFLVPSIIEAIEERTKSSQGKDQLRVKLKIKYSIFADDGSFIEAIVDGEGIDTSDKATSKAMTAAFKYLLTQMFCIAVADITDPDADEPALNFVSDKKDSSPEMKKRPPNMAPTGKDLKIPAGTYAGRKLSEIPRDEILVYIEGIEAAVAQAGGSHPKWFLDLKKAVES